MARKQPQKRSIIVVTIFVAVFAAILANTRTKTFSCEEYLSTNANDNSDPRMIGCFFQKRIGDNKSASISQKGRIQRDTDTFLWSLFANAFAANPNTPYLYTVLPLISLEPFGSWLPSPMWRISDKRDAAVFIGKMPPQTTYMGFTTFCLWKPFRFVFASLGDSSNSMNIRYDPETGLFAYVICFANTTSTPQGEDWAYSTVMEALVASGLPEAAINVQALDPDLLTSHWAFYELVLRIFHFSNHTQGTFYLESHSHNHPFYYVSAAKSTTNNDPSENTRNKNLEQDKNSTKLWSIPSKPTGFKNTFHSTSMNENEKLELSFLKYGKDLLADLSSIFSQAKNSKSDLESNFIGTSVFTYTNHSFGPLYVADGTGCVRNDTECLGGCPDAAYFGLNVGEKNETFQTLPSWSTSNELHVVTLVDHRAHNNSVYGSMAVLASSRPELDPKHLTKNVRATSVGITSPDLFGDSEDTNSSVPQTLPFATWIFTRNQNHCKLLSHHHSPYGCTVIDSKQLSKANKYVTYLERIYLNPLTGTRPDEDNILPARLYRVILDEESKETKTSNLGAPDTLASKERMPKTDAPIANLPFSSIQLPPSQPVATFNGNTPLRFLHIIKTGGESLENYIWNEASLSMDYGACVSTAAKSTNESLVASGIRKSLCNALATLTSKALCGLNCECCATDLFLPQTERNTEKNGFHGTMLRSPRAHVMSQFSHCHAAHHTNMGRILRDVPLFVAEGILRLTEEACWSSCDTEGDEDWYTALQKRLNVDERNILPYYSTNDKHDDVEEQSIDDNDRVLVISIHNTQSHALTCGKAKGSFGHHFRRISKENPIDEHTPSLDGALDTLQKFEWFGITELFMPSLCLLHYQANQELPPKCDCDSPEFVEHDSEHALGYWKETRSQKRNLRDLSPDVLSKIDDHIRIDNALYAEAVRIFLGKLRSVEEETGTSLLKCIQWNKFRAKTEYLTELWNNDSNGLLI